jgi:hypothetical protein
VPTRPPRRGSLSARLELVLASFAPAFGLLAIRLRETVFWIPAASLAVLGVVVLIGVAFAARSANAEPYDFEDINDSASDVIGHISTYLAAIVIDPSDSGVEIIIAAVVFALVFLIHVSTGRVHVSPLIYVVGYRTYTAVSHGTAYYLIAKSDVADWNGTVRVARVAASVLVEKEQDRANAR